MHFLCGLRTAVEEWITYCASNRNVVGSIPDGVSGFFIDIKNLRSNCDTGDDSASNRNEYQENFLVVKSDGRKADNLPPSCAFVTKSGTLNFLEHSGPVQACNGTALNLGFVTVV